MKKVGLTLGKFAPLHRGHQMVIDTARTEMEEVIVMIYDAPEVTDIPLGVRADWIRDLYPEVIVVECWDGPTEVGYGPDLMRRHESYVLGRLGAGAISVTHFYSSEAYGAHMSRALGAADRRVDPDRLRVPISGTQLRADPSLWAKHLDPRVRKDLVVNIALLGAPSTGKTTLAGALAQRHETVWMPEHGREYWQQHQVNRRLTQAQLVDLAQQHLALEDEKLLAANLYLFSDTNAMTTALFCRNYHGRVPAALQELANQAAARYDLFLVCDTDIPYEDTWDRSGDVQRAAFQRQVIDDLRARRLPFLTIRGTLDDRLAQVATLLGRHRKFMPASDLFGSKAC